MRTLGCYFNLIVTNNIIRLLCTFLLIALMKSCLNALYQQIQKHALPHQAFSMSFQPNKVQDNRQIVTLIILMNSL